MRVWQAQTVPFIQGRQVDMAYKRKAIRVVVTVKVGPFRIRVS